MPRKPEPVNPCESPWHLLGAELRYWRDQVRGLTLRQAGKLAFCDDADLSKWERGLARPQADTVRRLDEVYGANGRLIALHAFVAELERLRILVRKTQSNGVDATERRQLLQFAAVSAGFGALNPAAEPIRQLLHMDLPDDRTVEDWQLACTDHLKALHTRPPDKVSTDLCSDLIELQRQLRITSNATEVIELRRVVAALSYLQAIVLSRLGEHVAALRWWQTARTAADATGDLHLRLGIRASTAGHMLGHGQRNAAAVLRLADQARELAGDAHSMGTAFIQCTRAKALATLGRHKEARAALRECRNVMEAAPPAADIMPEVWYMRGGQLEYSELWVSAEAGDEKATLEARDRVLSLAEDYEYRIIAHLHLAMCTVKAGGMVEGVRYATDTIGSVPPEFRTNYIDKFGGQLLQIIPEEQRQHPAVNDLRHLLITKPHVSI